MTALRRWRRWPWLAPLLLALAGCGPGVGGTGTGEQGSALNFFGARPASVCTAAFAGELKCSSRVVVGPSTVDPAEGSELVVWADDPEGANVTAKISGSDIDFEALCEGVRFAGTWGRTSEGAARFFGRYTAPGLSAAVLGTLSVQGADGAQLTYVLRDAAGQDVLGPRALQRTPEVPPPLCPKSSSSPIPASRAR